MGRAVNVLLSVLALLTGLTLLPVLFPLAFLAVWQERRRWTEGG